MANSYVTSEQIRALMPDTEWGQSYNILLTTLAERASRAIDRFTGREPGAYAVSATTTRYFDGSGEAVQWIGEMAAAPTTVSMALTGDVDTVAGSGGTYTALATTDYWMWPYNATSEAQPYQRIELDTMSGAYSLFYKYPRGIKVVGYFGYATTAGTPPDVVQVAAIQATRWFKRGQLAYQDFGGIVELGQIKYLQALDPDVAEMIRHYRRLAI